MAALKKVFRWVLPSVQKTADGREKWPSRTAYILAAMGGAVGFGNLLRYPSTAFKNSGVQWFIPYFISLFFVGVPILLMEICFGQVYRGGAVKAYGRQNPRLRGLGLATVYIGFIVVIYYVVIMSWILTYLRNSFISPLPWVDDNQAFFEDVVIQNPAPIQPPNGLWKFPDHGMNWETFGWTMLSWVLVFFSIFKGVSFTGKVVYFTMLFPLALIFALTIRAVTLSNAREGTLVYIGSWSWDKLFGGQIWTDALIQIFFSISIGFGYYTAYASYNSAHANAVQDTLIIACSNSFIEVFAGFAAFAVLGHLGKANSELTISSFDLGFLTYPQALAKLPGSNVWAVLFFLTLFLLGVDSAFAMVEGLITVVLDTSWGKRPPRMAVVLVIVLTAAAISVMYCTAFGKHLMDGVDIWVTEVTLIFSMWLQCAMVTSLYRYKDVVEQTGMVGYLLAQGSYYGGTVLGLVVGHTVSIGAGFGVYVGIVAVGTTVAAMVAETPEVGAPKPFGSIGVVSKIWWLTFYPGHQLRNDWNAVVAQGKNWGIPLLWGCVLRWFSAPFLAVILSLAYNNLGSRLRNPMEIFGFIMAHLGVVVVVISIIVPRCLNVFVPKEEQGYYLRQYEGHAAETLAPDEDLGGVSDAAGVDSVAKDEAVVGNEQK